MTYNRSNDKITPQFSTVTRSFRQPPKDDDLFIQAFIYQQMLVLPEFAHIQKETKLMPLIHGNSDQYQRGECGQYGHCI